MYFLLFFMLFIRSIRFIFTSDQSNTAQSFYCEIGLETQDLCPIDGGWTSWSTWGPCTGQCGLKGKKIRSRSCNNPSPSNNGASCIGPSYQVESCQITGCTIKDYERNIHSNPIRKEEMKVINVIHETLPALIELCFSVDCTYSIVQKILGDDAMTYWNAMNCVKYNVGCPIFGGWSHWESWSPCTAACGRGQKYRIRKCNSPPPTDSELTCDGLAFETKSCTSVSCKQHSKGTWLSWSEWSKCSVDCGSGIKVRERLCVEMQGIDATSCEGATKEIKACEMNNCTVNGAWSPWTTWTTCSSNCGIGTQLRNRMCNNPSPSGNGITCSGSASEIRQCFTKPCSESSLFYTVSGVYSRLLHAYLRFLPLSPFGVLLHRFEDNCKGLMCNFVRISLHNGKVILLSQISGCTLSLVHENKLQIGQWHVILVFLYGTYAMLRVDNDSHKIASFSCTPILYNLDHSMRIGEGFQGQIQEIAINFVPIRLRVPKDEPDTQEGYQPYHSNAVQYLMGDDEEGFTHVALTESIAAPCPKKVESWRVVIALKTEDLNGIIAMIPGDSLHRYILILLEEGRVKLKCHQGTTHLTIESTEHVSMGEWFEVIVVQDGQNLHMQINGNEKRYLPSITEKTIIACTDNIFIGAIRSEIKETICPKCSEIPQMHFTLGYFELDGNPIDLLSLPALETTSKRFTSRTISLSDYYKEIPLTLGQEFKLSCFYDQTSNARKSFFKSAHESYVTWLLMDKPLNSYGKRDDVFTLKDDGRVSTISAASYVTRTAVENFYSCHIGRYKSKLHKDSRRAIFTFGISVVDENEEFGHAFWKKWSFICEILIICLILLIIWLLIEAFWDIRNGHGLYRLPQAVVNNDPSSIINFILSTDGVTLLGSQQAADEIIAKIAECNRIHEVEVKE